MEDALTWFARSVHDWPCDFIAMGFPSYFDHPEYRRVDFKEDKAWIQPANVYVAKEDWLQRRAELQNKPRFEDHPDAKCFVQNKSGLWAKNIKTSEVEPNEDGGCYSAAEGWHLLYQNKGEVLGDWKSTLEKRPEKRELNPPTSSLTNAQQRRITIHTGMCADGWPCGSTTDGQDAYCTDCPNRPCNYDGCTDRDDEVVIPPPPEYDPADVAFPPSKYHRKIKGKWCDVYDVLQAWSVTNPALQHLIKKALQAGNRGHKDLETDLQDIIDSAIRAKELGDE